MANKCDWLVQRWERAVKGWIPFRTLVDLSEDEAMKELQKLRGARGEKFRIFREFEELDPHPTGPCQLELRVYHTNEDVSDLESCGIQAIPSRIVLGSDYESPAQIIRTLIVVMYQVASQELQETPGERFYEFACLPYRFLCELDLFLAAGGDPADFAWRPNGNHGG